MACLRNAAIRLPRAAGRNPLAAAVEYFAENRDKVQVIRKGGYSTNISIETSPNRLPEAIEAFDKNEQVALSRAGRKFALPQPVPGIDIEDEIRRIKNHPAIGTCGRIAKT